METLTESYRLQMVDRNLAILSEIISNPEITNKQIADMFNMSWSEAALTKTYLIAKYHVQ